MQSKEIFLAIEKIASTPGKNDKIALLKSLLADQLAVKILSYTYNPLVTFGIANVPGRSHPDPEGTQFDPVTFTLIEEMAARRLTGGAMYLAVANEFNRLDADSATLLKRILTKDMRAGFTDGSINKARPGTIPEFPYMRCCLPKDAKFDKFDWTNGCFSQEKADGMFANVTLLPDGSVSIQSRQGTVFPDAKEFTDIKRFVSLMTGIPQQFHGELLVIRGNEPLPREIGNGMLNKLAKGGELEPGLRVQFLAWDAIDLEHVKPDGDYCVPYWKRFGNLSHLVLTTAGAPSLAHHDAVVLINTRVVHSLAEAYGHYRELLADGKEGTIVKDRNAFWKDGTSKQQVKLKLEVTVDLRVKGFIAGNGKNEGTFGSIVCQTEDGLLEVAVSGFTDKEREEIHARREEILESIMAVKANGVMKPSEEGKKYSLFLPRSVEFRQDKKVADTLQQVLDQFEAATK